MDLDRFEITGEQDKVLALRRQLAHLIALRWFYVGLLAAVAVISSRLAGHPPEESIKFLITGLAVIGVNAVLFAVNKWVSLSYRLAQFFLVFQLLLDLTLATYLTFDQGGLEARTTALFALPIIAAGFLFTKAVVYVTAILAGAGYILSVLFAARVNGMGLEASSLVLPIIFYPAFYLVIARVVVRFITLNIVDTKQKAYDDFLALLSHQLMHPASTSRTILDLIEMSEKKGEDNKKYLKMLKSENDKLIELLRNLVEAAWPNNNDKISNINISSQLEKVASKIAKDQSREKDLTIELPESNVQMKINSEKLLLILGNIIGNAFKYSGVGDPIEIKLNDRSDRIEIVVNNKGAEISSAIKKQLFRQKYLIGDSKSRPVSGLGLGLYVANKAIKSMNGQLSLKSRKNETHVKIMLKKG